MKSTLLLRPVHHWTEKRIRAHVFVCVIALQVERWTRKNLRGIRLSCAPDDMSVQRALGLLQRIKIGEVEVGGKRASVPTRPTADQKAIIAALDARAAGTANAVNTMQ